ncbi:DUF1707 SHOCT-like domain-containing protein [Nocardioides guangzhouensis]|nr:DUF1707 domain-containing protein [Nocardioides guangzhouensis]
MSTPSVWQQFSADPRDRAHASLRASDADRDLVRRVLADAYAEGRLDRDELDERVDAAGIARVLGDLPPLIDDLVPTAIISSTARAMEAIPQRAEARWESMRREALWRLIGVSGICWAVWLATSVLAGAYFPWPLIVMAVTGLHFARVTFNRDEIIAQETRRLEKRERKSLAIDELQKRFLGPGQPYWHQRGPHRRRWDDRG